MARILLIENERIIGEYLREVIAGLGHAVAFVSTGLDAVLHVTNDLPDLILMDVQLGSGMDGIETTGLIRQQFDVPVIYLTALGDRKTRQRADATAPIGYLSKPVRECDLAASIDGALQGRREEHLHGASAAPTVEERTIL